MRTTLRPSQRLDVNQIRMGRSGQQGKFLRLHPGESFLGFVDAIDGKDPLCPTLWRW